MLPNFIKVKLMNVITKLRKLFYVGLGFSFFFFFLVSTASPIFILREELLLKLEAIMG